MQNILRFPITEVFDRLKGHNPEPICITKGEYCVKVVPHDGTLGLDDTVSFELIPASPAWSVTVYDKAGNIIRSLRTDEGHRQLFFLWGEWFYNVWPEGYEIEVEIN